MSVNGMLSSHKTVDMPPKRIAAMRPGAFAVIWILAGLLALVTAGECSSVLHLSSLLYGCTLWGWWAAVASMLWSAGERKPYLSEFSQQSVLLHTGAAIVLGAVHLIVLWSLGYAGMGWYGGLPKWTAFHALLNLNRFGIELLVYGFVFGLIGIVQYQLQVQRERTRSLELERQLSAAQLRALQMQLEPHFLFNTLNAVTTLVELGRQPEAAQMLGHLNILLKRALEQSTPQKIPLSQELEIVEHYLAIEQVRFADRLRIDIKIDPGALRSLVPCFLLQPIVENAIRHGIAHCEGEGTVTASARREGDRLHITVSDTGPGKTCSSSGGGIGLKNTRERLALFFPEQHVFRAGQLGMGGFEVVIDVPFETAG